MVQALLAEIVNGELVLAIISHGVAACLEVCATCLRPAHHVA